MTVEEAINFLDNLVYEQTQKRLTRLQQSIARGVLGGLTYQEIQQNDPPVATPWATWRGMSATTCGKTSPRY
ncbi:hypothetical protein [Microcoleus sp. B4-D4]|uniref:hypothetical protein n=1 Tax=Microcoleus sp. B4-D4 TaxID=2818667 RepID=UPI002FD70979